MRIRDYAVEIGRAYLTFKSAYRELRDLSERTQVAARKHANEMYLDEGGKFRSLESMAVDDVLRGCSGVREFCYDMLRSGKFDELYDSVCLLDSSANIRDRDDGRGVPR